MKISWKILSFFVILGFFLLPLLKANNEESERSLSRQKRKLFFPRYTTLQISLCLVAQVSSIPSHRVALNSGFQMNYDLPYRLTDFYSPIYWARALTNMSSPVTDFMEKLVKSEEERTDDENEVVDDSESDVDDDESDNNEFTTQKDSETTTEVSTTEKMKRKRKPKMKRETKEFADLTAGQFYSGIRETLSYSGYHEDCLLKSVCELAQHPLQEDEDNVVSEVLHFVLTPSLHQSFDPETEFDEKFLFEEAEKMGKSGADCETLYGLNCKTSPLKTISRFIQSENEI